VSQVGSRPLPYTLRVATRASRLALAQTQSVVDALQAQSKINCQIISFTTKGDREADRSLIAIGGDGVFVRELFTALARGQADIAVHSLKDLPTSLPRELSAGVVPVREDPRDALVAAREGLTSIQALPERARVGTSSLRRAAQLRLLRPDLDVVGLRGNVDTRARKIRDGQCDAAVLAYAGLRRAGLLETLATTPLDPDEMVPAAGQGALFVQCRADDEKTRALIAPLEHGASALATSWERAFLAAVGGGCVAPIGVHVRIEGVTCRFWAVVAATDGTRAVRESRSWRMGDAAEGRRTVEAVASEMLAAGAGDLIAQARERVER
jgi:hydroxymethylbilane synthase